jgi:glycosyltransferase involved in cell wall biosynthesis
VITNSDAGAKFAVSQLGVRPLSLRVIRNGIDFDALRLSACPGRLRQELGIAAAHPVIGFIGRKSPAKNVPRFLSVVRNLIPYFADLHVVLVGYKLDEAARAELAPDLPRERMHFLGPREDVPALLADFDVLVLTSDSEGTPNVVLEAAGIGIPVVAADVGDVRRIIRDGVNGFVVPARDIGAYVTSARTCVERAAEFKRTARDCWPPLEATYGLHRMAAETISVWETCLDRFNRPGTIVTGVGALKRIVDIAEQDRS